MKINNYEVILVCPSITLDLPLFLHAAIYMIYFVTLDNFIILVLITFNDIVS